MASHGNAVLENTDAITLGVAGAAGVGVRQESHIHNSGPDLIRVVTHSDDLGSNEGYPLAAGERETFTHSSLIYFYCPTASGGNHVTVDFLTVSG